ncbi:MAG TPA: SPOR domain-containing protein [Longimicrobiales bacterium]|jgi:cell division septation protein DedD
MSTTRLLRSVRAGVALVAATLAVAASPAAGQDGLERADALARAGRADEARAQLSAWWDSDRGSASRADLQRGIWLRALLTVEPQEASLDFQRLVVEFPGGRFSDQALLRLAQAAEAAGDPHGAADHHRVILRDYPGSPLRLDSRSWLDSHEELLARTPRVERPAPRRAEPEPEPEVVEEAAPPEPPAPDTAAAGDVTVVPEVAAVPAELPGKHDVRATEAVPDSTPPEPSAATTRPEFPQEPPLERPPELPPVSEPEGDYTVQLGAFSGEAGARLLSDRATRAGLDPRTVIVVGSPLLRVRVGRFSDADPATRLYDRVVRMGFEAMVLADATRERPPGEGGLP